MEGFGSGLKDIAVALVGVGFIALLVGNSQGAVSIINAGGKTFAGLLGVVTLQSQYANAFNGYF
jgi:arginine exporter protein ArgO